MQTLSPQEVTQISGAFSTDNIIKSAGDGMVIGAALTGIALFLCPVGNPVIIGWSLLSRGAAICGGLQLLVETKNYFDC